MRTLHIAPSEPHHRFEVPQRVRIEAFAVFSAPNPTSNVGPDEQPHIVCFSHVQSGRAEGVLRTTS